MRLILYAVLLVIGLFVIFGKNSGGSGEVRVAEFSSLHRCLAAIEKDAGLTLKPFTDKPEEVSGRLGDTRRNFVCEKKVTGTRGVYWEGWYEP